MLVAAPAEVAAGVDQEAEVEVTRAPEARRGRLALTAEVAGAEAEAALDQDHRGQGAGSRGQGLDQAPDRAPGQGRDQAAAVQLAASQAVGAGVAADSLAAEAGQEARAGPDQAPGLRQDPDPNPNPNLVLRHQLGPIDETINHHKRYDMKHTRRGWCPRTGLRAAVNEYFCG